MYKVRLLLLTSSKELFKFGTFHSELYLRETVVHCYGKHSGEICMQGSQLSLVNRAWCPCTSDGYPYKC
jgi:hypothetical protein